MIANRKLEDQSALDFAIKMRRGSIWLKLTDERCDKLKEGTLKSGHDHRQEKLPQPLELEDLPACEQGMELARVFLTSCGEGVDRVGVDELADRMTQINAAYTAFVEHIGDCDNCNEK